jgi:hypothetical protein
MMSAKNLKQRQESARRNIWKRAKPLILNTVSVADFRTLEESWPRTNRERGLLIDKKIAGNLNDIEQARLNLLQEYADYHIDQVAPRPINELVELERQANECTCDVLVIDGQTYIGGQPDCPTHGLEAHVKAHAPYYAEATKAQDMEPISMKGRE